MYTGSQKEGPFKTAFGFTIVHVYPQILLILARATNYRDILPGEVPCPRTHIVDTTIALKTPLDIDIQTISVILFVTRMINISLLSAKPFLKCTYYGCADGLRMVS